MDLTLLFVGIWFTRFTKRNVRLRLCLLLSPLRLPLFLANFSLSLSLNSRICSDFRVTADWTASREFPAFTDSVFSLGSIPSVLHLF